MPSLMSKKAPWSLSQEISRFHRRNWFRLRTPALYETAHLFFPAHPDDEAARAEAKLKAQAVLDQLLQAPQRFGELAVRSLPGAPSPHRPPPPRRERWVQGRIFLGHYKPATRDLYALSDPANLVSHSTRTEELIDEIEALVPGAFHRSDTGEAPNVIPIKAAAKA
jgi:hypothetical protein